MKQGRRRSRPLGKGDLASSSQVGTPLAARDPNQRKESASDIARAEIEKADWERSLVEGRQLHEKHERDAKAAAKAAELAKIEAEQAAIRAEQERLEGLRSGYLRQCMMKAAVLEDPIRGIKVPLDECVHLDAVNLSVGTEANAVDMVTEAISHGISLHQKVKLKFCNMIVFGQISRVHDDLQHFDVALLNRQEMVVKNSDEVPLPARLGKFQLGLTHYKFGKQGKQKATLVYEDKFFNSNPETTKLMRKNNYAVSVINQKAIVEASPREPKEVSIMKCMKVEKTQILPQPLLITAPPGGGKTTFANQLMHTLCAASILLRETGLVPVLLPAAAVARWAMGSENFADFKLDQMSFFSMLKSLEFDEQTVGVLWHARCDSRLLVLIDAVDELAGPSKSLVERFICKVLAREMKVVVFARDAGYDTKAFSFFQRIRLHSLSPEQQQTVVERALTGSSGAVVASGSASAAAVAAAVAHEAAQRLLKAVHKGSRGHDELTAALKLPFHLATLVALALTHSQGTGSARKSEIDINSGSGSESDSNSDSTCHSNTSSNGNVGNSTVKFPGLHRWDFSQAGMYDRVLHACVARAVSRAQQVEKVSAEMLKSANGHMGVELVEGDTSNGETGSEQKTYQRRALVRRALQQIALWVHEAHYVRGASTVVAKRSNVEEREGDGGTSEALVVVAAATSNAAVPSLAVESDPAAAAEAAEEAEAVAAAAATASSCANQTRQFTLSAAKTAGVVDEEALAELELILALPRRKVARPEESRVEEEEGGEKAKDKVSGEEGSSEEYSSEVHIQTTTSTVNDLIKLLVPLDNVEHTETYCNLHAKPLIKCNNRRREVSQNNTRLPAYSPTRSRAFSITH
jgi:hypothetical protein